MLLRNLTCGLALLPKLILLKAMPNEASRASISMATLEGRKPMKTSSKQRRPASLNLLVSLLILLGLGALFGGYSLVADPTGGRLPIPVDLLEGTPFRDYFLPGLILFIVLGIFPLFTAYALWRKPSWSFLTGLERLTHKHWSWLASVTAGIALVIWIIVQGMMLGFGHPLQVIYLLLGIVIVVVSLLPSVRRYCA